MKYKLLEILIQSAKIMVGSSSAMFIAQYLELEYATSAGIIALLTLVTTKLETLRLSVYRLITFAVTVFLTCVIFQNIGSMWIAYGIFIFLIVFMSEFVGWRATISVNAVIGTHYISNLDFSWEFMFNELQLVLIGISIAIVLNFFTRNSGTEKRLVHNMEYTEDCLRRILEEIALYLNCEQKGAHVWKDMQALEQKIEHFIEQACEYNNNTFHTNGDYYERYFEMRLMQVGILHNLHYELRKMRSMPKEAKIISDFMKELTEYVFAMNNPRQQILDLEVAFEELIRNDLPKNVEELEGRAKLYHILMDLEEFLMHKMRFVDAVENFPQYKKECYSKKVIKKI